MYIRLPDLGKVAENKQVPQDDDARLAGLWDLISLGTLSHLVGLEATFLQLVSATEVKSG